MELYNEVIHDLLAPIENVTSSKLKIYETADGSCKINCTEIMCSSKAEAIDAFQKGTQRRQTAETALNTQSSRSHAVFIINTITDVIIKMKYILDLIEISTDYFKFCFYYKNFDISMQEKVSMLARIR